MINWLPFLSYVFVTTFTPGPNNLISTAAGVRYGFKKTLPFIGGVVTGFFTIMFACSIFIEWIYGLIPGIEQPLRIIGASYILWLACNVLKSRTNESSGNSRDFSLKEGLLLQYVNPKVIIYGITVMSSFIVPYVKDRFLLALASLFLAFAAFCSTSLWALAGAIFRKYLIRDRPGKIFNAVMAILLVYSAYSMIGIFDFRH